jgi:hypothetical protein
LTFFPVQMSAREILHAPYSLAFPSFSAQHQFRGLSLRDRARMQSVPTLFQQLDLSGLAA